MSKYVYPAIFHVAEEGGYWVEFPDLPCATEGEDIADALDAARDALALLLYSYEVDGESIPKASNLKDLNVDGEDFASYVGCDTMEYRRYYNNKAGKKTVSIPEWLNVEAMAKGLNFSKILQEGLKEALGL